LLVDYTSESGIFSVEVNNISELSDVVFDACKCVATAEGCLRPSQEIGHVYCSEKCKKSSTAIAYTQST